MNQTVDEFNDKAREIEAQLEELGQMICDIPKSGASWQHVNRALSELRGAIYDSYVMYQD